MVFSILFCVFILASIMAFVVVWLQMRWLKKMRGYVKVEAQITKTVKEHWSGDTADRNGGEYHVPVAQFYVEPHGNISFMLRDAEHIHYRVGQKITMAYPSNAPQQAVVFDQKKVISNSIRYSLMGLILATLSILLWYGTGLNLE